MELRVSKKKRVFADIKPITKYNVECLQVSIHQHWGPLTKKEARILASALLKAAKKNTLRSLMFERFTEKAIKVIMLAQEEARRLGHNFVGTEQILLGLIGEGTGIAAKTLKSMGVNLKDARVEVEKIIGRGSGFVAVEIPYTPRCKRLLEFAWDEARQLGHNYIGTEHILLGLIREGEGVAGRVLGNLNVDLTELRNQVLILYGITTVKAYKLQSKSFYIESILVYERRLKSINLEIDMIKAIIVQYKKELEELENAAKGESN